MPATAILNGCVMRLWLVFVGGLGGEELDVVGVADLDGGGEDAGELDEEAFFA